MTRPPSSDETGETLLEVLIAVAIMGIAVVAIMAGLTTSILMSDIHRKQATAGTYVRDYAEAVQTSVAGGTYGSAADDYAPDKVAFEVPPGSGLIATVDAMTCWSGSAWQSCGLGDTGLQRIALKVTDNKRVTERLVTIVRKP
ncbi:pilin/secretion family protein with methylation motif [Kribbella sp. VKM Ac-2571]|uniref:type IV pilus modification PilV family protein n=1 Tax=Kribbella sp. VKM Ac-2571 TaxID=2512222 RepID=UPI00105FDCE4|nr:type II secretion system protein [Kribbella sp. VKM Ac-2571]TDO64047.1 pilin/secretion family protein with methylation motif [Kribbella sp. VKM Ac-2571]